MTRLLAALLLLCQMQCAAMARPQVILVLANHLSLTELDSAEFESGLRSVGADPFWIQNFTPLTLVSPGLPDKIAPIETNYRRMADSSAPVELTEGGLAPFGMDGLQTTILGSTSGDDVAQTDPVNAFISDPNYVAYPDRPDPLAPGGLISDPEKYRDAVYRALKSSDLIVVQWGSFDRVQEELAAHILLPEIADTDKRRTLTELGRFLMLLAGDKRASESGVLWLVLVSPLPPSDGNGGWNSLTPFVVTRIDLKIPSTAYSSSTTQTDGLIAQRDIGPTVLSLLNQPMDPRFTGAAAHSIAGVSAVADIKTLDRETRNNQIIEVPFFWSMGIVLGFIGFGVVWALRGTRSVRALLLCSYGLRVIAVWPGAMLAATALPVSNPQAYFVLIYALMGLLALLPSVTAILTVTSMVLIADCLTGSHLISGSLFSAYTLSGIRFYGIGNEYMGVLIAGTLLASRSVFEMTSKKVGFVRIRSWRLPVLVLYAIVTLVTSCPEFGAKAGAALTCGATFGSAYGLFSTGRFRLRSVTVGLIAGALLLIFWVAASPTLGLRQTHLQLAFSDAWQRPDAIAAMVSSKLELAETVLKHPGTIVGGLALILFGVSVSLFLRSPLNRYFEERPASKSVYSACLTGCVASILLNDSGVVAAILVFSMTTVELLYDLVIERCVLLPLISEKSGSVSPPAIL